MLFLLRCIERVIIFEWLLLLNKYNDICWVWGVYIVKLILFLIIDVFRGIVELIWSFILWFIVYFF